MTAPFWSHMINSLIEQPNIKQFLDITRRIFASQLASIKAERSAQMREGRDLPEGEQHITEIDRLEKYCAHTLSRSSCLSIFDVWYKIQGAPSIRDHDLGINQFLLYSRSLFHCSVC